MENRVLPLYFTSTVIITGPDIYGVTKPVTGSTAAVAGLLLVQRTVTPAGSFPASEWINCRLVGVARIVLVGGLIEIALLTTTCTEFNEVSPLCALSELAIVAVTAVVLLTLRTVTVPSEVISITVEL